MDGDSVIVEALRSASQLEEVRGKWTAWVHHPNSDPGLYSLLLAHRKEVVRPHVLLLRRSGVPEALLLGRLENRRLELKIGYRTVYGPRVRQLVFMYQGYLGHDSEDNSAAFMAEIKRSLAEGEADLAYFNSLTPGSSLYRCATTVPGVLCRDYCMERRQHWVLDLANGLEGFYEGLSPKVRKNRRQEATRLLRDYAGDVRISCYRKPAEVPDFARDAEKVAQTTYLRGLNAGFQDCPEVRERLAADARAGRLSAYVLYAAERPCAFLVLSLYDGTAHGIFTGYDPALGKYSPGTYLMLKVIEELCRCGVKYMDFGLGHAWYKELLCNRSWSEESFYIFGPTLRGVGLNSFRTPLILASRAAEFAFRRANALDKLKRIWRAALRPRNACAKAPSCLP